MGMTDQLQPYGGARDHASRVHWNESTRATTAQNAFGANQIEDASLIQTGNDWHIDRDFHADSLWADDYHSYTATGGTTYGHTASEDGGVAYSATQYTGRDWDHAPYVETGVS